MTEMQFAGRHGFPNLYQTEFIHHITRIDMAWRPLKIVVLISQTTSKLADLFNEDTPIDVNSSDKSMIEKLRLLDELEEVERKSIFNIIDMAITKKRLKDTLSNALNTI